MMASKPRNISSSPTNLSPSRVATLRNASGRSSGNNGGDRSKKGPTSSPMSTGTAGRTPQTRRKELALPQNQPNSPMGSPKNQNQINNSSTVKKTSTVSNSANSRKNSLNGNGSSGHTTSRTTTSKTNRRTHRDRGLSTTSTSNSNSNHTQNNSNSEKNSNRQMQREETKFDGLWDVKSVKDGLVRLPTKCLEELITKESIEKYYEVEDTPVAR